MGSAAPKGGFQKTQQHMRGGPQQGKGPGLPMPKGGDRNFQPRPYEPVGVTNPPFNPNPVQPIPGNMPQGKGPGQLPLGITPQMLDAYKQQNIGNPNAKGPGQLTPQQLQAVQAKGPAQLGQQLGGQVPSQPMLQQGKGPTIPQQNMPINTFGGMG